MTKEEALNLSFGSYYADVEAYGPITAVFLWTIIDPENFGTKKGDIVKINRTLSIKEQK